MLQQSGKNSHYVETVFWTGTQSSLSLLGGLVPISIDLPSDQPTTDSSNPFDQILWRLMVQAPSHGPSFLEKYEIPVHGHTAAAQKLADAQARTHSPATSARRTSMLPVLLIGLAICIGGLFVLALGLSDLANAGGSTGWPTVPGLIRASSSPASRSVFVHSPDLVYDYVVNGTAYSGRTIYPHILWRQAAAQAATASYPVGTTTTVHYAPSDPGNSLLETGLRPGAFQRLLMGLLIITFGSIFAVSAILAPTQADITGNSFTFRKGTLGSKFMGYAFLGLLLEGVTLWFIS